MHCVYAYTRDDLPKERTYSLPRAVSNSLYAMKWLLSPLVYLLLKLAYILWLW